MPAMDVEAIADVLMEHTIFPGVSASPGHWAWEAKERGEGAWFVHCGTSWEDQKGCGWSSEPETFENKMDAKRAGMLHLAEELGKVGS